MAFKLSTGGGSNRFAGTRASDEDIKRQTSIGKTHISFEGASYFIYIEDEGEREEFKKQRGVSHFEWFQEKTGNKNWVLYNPMQFKQDLSYSGKKILKFNTKDYKGGKIELPINASSCCGMFSWITLPEGFSLGKMFDTREIVDMTLMFAGSVIPKDFSLGEYFDTSNVESMSYMFYQCMLPYGFSFGDKWSTKKVKTMEYMFSEAKLPKDMVLPESFDTRHIDDLKYMFFESNINGNFNFGPNFKIKEGADITKMFYDCFIGENKIKNWYAEDFTHVRAILDGSIRPD